MSGSPVDLSTQVGAVRLRAAVMTASGTAGHADELGAYNDLAALGAVVVKSLSAEPWPGNTAPRVHPTPAGMLNSVGLQGPGVAHWVTDGLPRLRAVGAAVVASIWGRSVQEYEDAAAALAGCGPEVVAVEVNLSCPNHGHGLFAHDPVASAEAISAAAVCGRPLWAKLSPNTDRVVEVAAACRGAGAEAVTLVNTLLGMVIDLESRRPALDGRGGGLSGPAIHPVAVRAVYDVHAALPDLPIVGVGGVASGADAVEMVMAGADAVQVGTASFADPRAPTQVLRGLEDWCQRHGVTSVAELKGSAHG